MARQVVSRTQRRMEKRQALVMLALLLVACLVSFSLGVMVGRGGSRDVLVTEQIPQEKPAVAAQAEEGSALQGGPAEEPESGELTFYDTLPQGQENALGSGINLPPVEEAKPKEQPAEKTVAQPVVKPVAKDPELPAELGPLAERLLQEKPVAPKPAATSTGSYVIQVASVNEKQGAEGLRARMAAKGYPAYVEQADLGAKGVWHRVFAGPYGSKEDAERVVAALKADKISSAPLLKKK
ncbi:MAG: SPOR domain-containing protein [Syntrophotaleaceae bacterium]